MRSKMLLVYRAPTGLEAHVVRSVLEQHGVPAEVRNEMLAPLAGGLPLTDVMVEVWIPEAHAEAAEDLLDTLRRPSEESGRLSLSDAPARAGALSEPLAEPGAVSMHERTCPRCGEDVPPELSECWNCQTELTSLG